VRHDSPSFAGAIWALGKERLIGFSLVGRGSVETSDKNDRLRGNVGLPPEKREDQTQHDANNDAGDDWEIERAVPAFDADIARQTTEPAGANATPKQKAKNNDHGSEDNEKFSELRHAKILAQNIRSARQQKLRMPSLR
jgi:hypothetical protein